FLPVILSLVLYSHLFAQHGSGSQAAINPRQPLGQAQYVVDYRVSHFSVHIPQLVFRLTIDRDAKRRNAYDASLPERHSRVLARVSTVAVVVIVWTPVR